MEIDSARFRSGLFFACFIEESMKRRMAILLQAQDIIRSYFYHHNMQLDLYAAKRHHASVSSTSSQEIDSARSRSGLFFAFFLSACLHTLACEVGILLLWRMLNWHLSLLEDFAMIELL